MDRGNVVPGMGKEEKHIAPPPLLLTIHGEEYEKQSFYNLLDNRCSTTRLPILNNKCVLGSAFGWLVLLDHSDGDSRGLCLVWNPATMDTIELMYFEDPCLYNRCLLSNSPTEPDCFIMFDQSNCSTQTVCRVSDGSYFQVNYEDLNYKIIDMVSFKGLICGITQPGFEFPYELVTIHVVGDTLEARPMLINGKHKYWGVPSQSIQSWITWITTYLIESPCGNELLLVTLMFSHVHHECGLHFKIFRVDVNTMVCEELENLDDRTIFIGVYGNGFCCYSESFGRAIKPNSIYYTDSNGMDIHVYDLDDRSTTTLLPCSDLDIDLKSSTNYWIDLPHNILDSILQV